MADEASRARPPNLEQKLSGKGRYVNLRGGFQADLSAGRGCYLLPNSPLK